MPTRYAVANRRGRIVTRTRRRWLAQFSLRIHRDAQLIVDGRAA